jgi:hypothetical protein
VQLCCIIQCTSGCNRSNAFYAHFPMSIMTKFASVQSHSRVSSIHRYLMGTYLCLESCLRSAVKLTTVQSAVRLRSVICTDMVCGIHNCVKASDASTEYEEQHTSFMQYALSRYIRAHELINMRAVVCIRMYVHVCMYICTGG